MCWIHPFLNQIVYKWLFFLKKRKKIVSFFLHLHPSIPQSLGVINTRMLRHTHTHTHIHTHTQTHTHVCMLQHTHTHNRQTGHTRPHAHTHTRTHAHTHAHTDTHIHTHTHTHMHSSHTDTHTHTHTQVGCITIGLHIAKRYASRCARCCQRRHDSYRYKKNKK